MPDRPQPRRATNRPVFPRSANYETFVDCAAYAVGERPTRHDPRAAADAFEVATFFSGGSAMSRFKRTLKRHRHTLLLIAAIFSLAVQPLVRWSGNGPLLYNAFAYLLMLAIFLAIFERRIERITAVALGIPVLVGNLVELTSVGAIKFAAAMVYHGFAVAFIGYAVVVILRGVFRSGRIGADQIAGALSGYVLAGVAWGNGYVMIDLTVDHAFQIAEGLQWQLAADDTRRSLFNYFSFATLTTMGYGDVTPRVPSACTMAWLEAMFGQYYLAILIGQLMGIRLAQSQQSGGIQNKTAPT
jgi:hypothetical protein